jgi:hypothetical protein
VAGFTHAYSIDFFVTGAPETVYVNYSQVFGLRFVATGLPASTYWSVYISGTPYSDTGATTNGTVYFGAPNGSYAFTVDPVFAFTATPASGTVVVDGANVSETIHFSRSPTYAVTLHETGLSSGSNWSVRLALPNGTSLTKNSTTATVVFHEPNGTYYFYPAAVGWQPNVTEGYLSVSGASVQGFVLFSQVFTVTFEETGLPTGSFWEVNYAGSYGYGYSSTLVFSEPNGNYTFYAYDSGSFVPSPVTGPLNVTGADLTDLIVYSSSSEATYSVTFTESGLPTGTNWTVECGADTLWSLGTSIVFTEINDSYDFEVADVGSLAPSPAEGTVVVAGADVDQAIEFGAPAGSYAVTFTESGLPNGATWYINITDQTPLQATIAGSSGTSVETVLPDATYSFTATVDQPGWTSPGGNFQVQDADLDIAVPFSPPPPAKYLVTFTETGLPVGSTWYANITGVASLSATVSSAAGTTVSISLANGSYQFVAATSNASWSTSSAGEFTVAGSGQDVPVVFSSAPEYVVTFQESGLPAGVTWYINVSGYHLITTVSASGGTTVSVSLPNGAYTYTAASSSASWTAASSASFSVESAAKTVVVAFATSTSKAAASGLGDLALWAGLALLAIVVALLLILLAGRRRKKKEPATAAPGGDSGTSTPPPPSGGP